MEASPEYGFPDPEVPPASQVPAMMTLRWQ